ncbi:MAG: polysaccharide biosynthesis C-terminal domain-containing protein, partial [Lachnospiraceae bacterium]|nr:polysaccharide biosynthesis C-terminal domain-containing protein [Lachnospiraceae bacterium]
MDTKQEIFTGKQLRRLILPLIMEQVLGITVGLADSIMVSSAGEAAVSGVSLVDSINILLINMFCSLSTGGAVAAAHHLGENQREKAVRTADQLLLCVTGISLAVALVSIACNRLILGAVFGTVEDDVMHNAVIYFYITAFSFPFLGIYNASSALSRAMGNSRITMEISILTNIVNIAGNAVLILMFHAGVYGVALSTLISRVLGAVIMYVVLLDRRRPIHLSGTLRVRIAPDIVRRIMRVGIPTGMDNCIFQVGKILVQSLIAGLGTTAITANAIAGVVAG